MEVTELRIGNYFSDDEGVVFNVHGISTGEAENNVWYGYELGFYLSEGECRPIPLTKEWLLKFGFEKDYESNFRKCYRLSSHGMAFTYNFSKHDKEENVFEVKGLRVEWPIITHVHRLQNLYFALTGEELKIKAG